MQDPVPLLSDNIFAHAVAALGTRASSTLGTAACALCQTPLASGDCDRTTTRSMVREMELLHGHTTDG
eukprot:PRCOL_00002623-RA